MALYKRKQYIVDKKFQLRISIKAVVLPLITIFIIGSAVLYFSITTNNYTNEIVKNQVQMIDMFLTTPALQNLENPIIKNGAETFKNNITMLVKIKRSNELVLYSIVVLIIVQSVLIFFVFIFTTHKISGPIYVMVNYLRELREGKTPTARPLREKDELKELYSEIVETAEFFLSKQKQTQKQDKKKASNKTDKPKPKPKSKPKK